MRTKHAFSRSALLALCLAGLAACAPEGDPLGIAAIPTDPASLATRERPDTHAPDHELVECEALRARVSGCEERCQLETN